MFYFTDLHRDPGRVSPHFTVTGGDVAAAACYRRGTHILTAVGDRPIETLRIGDAVPTRFGGVRQVKWIGRRSYDRRFVAGNGAILPVLIRAGALGRALPARDLFVSPKHAMLINGVAGSCRAPGE